MRMVWMVCVVLTVLCSCNSSKHPYKKRRKPAPCDCPKFNYAPQPDFGKDAVYQVKIQRFLIQDSKIRNS